MATRTKAASAARTWKSRAVTRFVEPGNWAECARCEQIVKFRARERRTQIICNVYVDNRWDRVEHYHPDCYEDADSPYGEPTE